MGCWHAMPAWSQTLVIDLSDEFTVKDLAVKAREASDLYDGKEYFHYAPSIFQGHPFFLKPEFVNGNVEYKGKLFTNVPLMYDCITDQLVLKHYNDFFRIQLFKDAVSSFTIGNSYFVNLSTTKHKGFYQELHKGKFTIYAKRIKRLKDNLEDKRVRKVVGVEDRFYYLKDGELVLIKNLKALLNEMGDKKGEVKKYVKKYVKKNKSNSNKELQYLLAVSYYDQIAAHEN